MKKRILSMVLAVLIALSAFSMSAFAAVTTGNANTDGTATWSFDDETGVLTVSGTGNITDIVSDTSWVYPISDNIKSIVIEDGITGIDTTTFSDCTNLESLTIADSVKYINDYAFADCAKLTSVVLPKNLVDLNYAFVGCTALTSITIPEENEYFKTVDGVLFDKAMTTLYVYPAGKTAKSYTVPDTVRYIYDEAFYDCDAIETVVLPESVVEIDLYAFAECSNLKSIDISKVDTIYEGAFYNCDSLTSVKLNQSIKLIEYSMFYDCDNLTTVDFGGAELEYIAYDAFYSCDKLENITGIESVKYLYRESFNDTAFYNNADNWENGVLYLDSFAIALDDAAAGNVTIKDGTTVIAGEFAGHNGSITGVTVPESVKYIGYYAFVGCTSLETIVLHDKLADIGYDAFEGTAYYNDDSNWENGALYIGNHLIRVDDTVTELTVKDGTVGIGGDACYYNENLTKVTIPSSVKFIGEYAFGECINLQTVVLSEGLETIGYYAFGYNVKLKTINLPSTLKRIEEEAFYCCYLLEDVTLPEGLEYIGSDAFNDCVSFTEISVPDSVTYIGTSVFENCENLVSAKLPKGLTEIPDDTFKNCFSLKNIILPEAFTAIGDEAFENTVLESITLPYTLKSIANDAFYGCDELNNVIFLGTQEEWDAVDIDPEDNEALLSAELTVHTHAFDEYVYNDDATYDADGTETATCDCGRTDTRTKDGSKLALIDTSEKFKDVKKDAWYKEFVDYAVSHEMFNGTSDTTFEPNAAMTRGMFVTVLSRIAGAEVDNTAKTKFTDVPTDRYYTGAVAWAAENDIVKGVSETEFAPNADVTREQMCTLLVRYAEYAGIALEAAVDEITFADEAKISNYAKEAVEICGRAGIINGKTATEFAPKEPATRAQVAKILTIFVRDFAKVTPTHMNRAVEHGDIIGEGFFFDGTK